MIKASELRIGHFHEFIPITLINQGISSTPY